MVLLVKKYSQRSWKKMKYSIQMSDTIHILAYIEIFKDTNFLSSEMIAKSVETNAANVRKIMSSLKKAGLIHTQVGKPNPTLAKEPSSITFLEIYRSIEGNTNLIQVDEKTNPNCVVGANIQTALSKEYDLLQKKVEEQMDQITLDTVIHDISALEMAKRPENKAIVERYL